MSGERNPSTGCLRETLVRDYVARTLSGGAADDVAAHLAGCDECRELVHLLERDRAGTLGTAPLEPAGADDAGALLHAMRLDRGSRTGQVVAGKYRLGEQLGAGGMGVVYQAVNTWTDRKVAIKLLHPWLSADADTLDRFRREARIAGRLSHPGIVDVLDLGQDPRDGSLYMVQEFLTGETMRQHLTRRGALPLTEAGAIILPIVSALAAAHDGGVIHRDVKPENIILATDSDGRVVPTLIDFGISKFTEADMPALLQTGRVMGTPLYMSPEQLRCDGPLDQRTDVWAVGVMLFELLAGRRPFEARSNAEAAAAVLFAKIPWLSTTAPAVPDAMARVVARALERDRERRYATMHELREGLLMALPAAAGTARPTAKRARRYVAAALLSVAVVAASLALRAHWRHQATTTIDPPAVARPSAGGGVPSPASAPAPTTLGPPVSPPVAQPAADAPAASVSADPARVASATTATPPRPRVRRKSAGQSTPGAKLAAPGASGSATAPQTHAPVAAPAPSTPTPPRPKPPILEL